MSQFFHERVLVMKTLGGYWDDRGRRMAVLLLCITLGLAWTAAAAQVDYTTTGLGPANNATGTGTNEPDLKTAMDNINAAVVADASTELANVVITVGNTQNAATGGDAAGYWHLYGTDDPDDYATNYYGFNTISISGNSATNKTLLTGNGVDTMLLKVLHAKDSIAVENLIVRGGSYTGGLTGMGTDAILGTEVGGAGMTLGHNGVSGNTISASQTITIKNVLADGNIITVNSANLAGTGRNAFGAGILVNAFGTNGGAINDHSDVAFDTVSLTGNKIIFTSNGNGSDNTGGDVSVRGGGARIAYAKSFEYKNATTRGKVESNEVTLTVNSLEDSNKHPHAAGGGISIDGGSAMEKVDISGVDFTGNTVTMNNNAGGTFGTAPVSYARGGAIYYNAVGAGGNTGISIAGSTFTGNKAVAGSTNSDREVNAYGGAGFFYLNDIDAVFSGVTFQNNSATSTAMTSDGVGGALAFLQSTGTNLPTATISGAKFDDNSAGGTRNAYGGAIYMEQGLLKVTDTSFTNNKVSGTNALGSAIFMNTAGANAASLDLEASLNAKTVFSGNTVNGDDTAAAIHFGNATGALSQNNAAMSVGGAGIVELLNPLAVAMNNNKTFTFTKSGAGTLRWDGRNTFDTTGGATNLNLQDGVIEFGKDFTAVASASTDFNVVVNSTAEIRFDASRVETLALFDFDSASSASMTAGNGTKLVASTGRSIKSYTKEFVIASGLTSSQIDDLVDDFDFSAGSGYLSATGLRNNGSGDLVATVVFNSPFTRANARRATDALEHLVDNLPGITEAEIAGMYANANNVSPELFMDQGFVMLHAVDRVAGNAVQFGLRDPHRLRMRMESASYRPSSPAPRRGAAAPAYMDGGAGQSLDDYDPYAVQSDGAYPRLMDCSYNTMSGFRFWTGYIGDWRSVSSHNGYNGYKVDRHGFLLGANYDFGTAGSIGAYGGYSHAKTRARGADSEIKSDSGHFGLMGRVSPLSSDRNFSIYADMGYHFSNNDTRRNLGGFNASGDFDQDVFTVGLEAEYVFCLGSLNLTPRAEARYTYLDQDDMNEGGTSSTRTGVTGFDRNSFTTRAGVEVSYDFKTDGLVVTPAVNLDWRHDYGTRRNAGTAYYLADPAAIPFSVASSRNDRDSLDIGVGVKAMKSLGSTKLGFNLAYNANISRRSDTHSLYAGVELGF